MTTGTPVQTFFREKILIFSSHDEDTDKRSQSVFKKIIIYTLNRIRLCFKKIKN
jgi:hypothetical protein